MKYLKLFLIFVFPLLTLIRCSDSGTQPSKLTATELTARGWENFEAAAYQSALDNFEEAISKDESFAEAYSGAGWAGGRLLKLNNAITYFSQAVAQNSSSSDSYAGLAFVYLAQKEYQLAIAAANDALGINNLWDFAHDQTLDYRDLRLLLAESYFALLDFSNSLAQVKILNPAFDANVSTFEGRSALAAEIERLRNVV